MSFLRDNIWEFAGVALALITACLSALWTWRRREHREISKMSRVSPLVEVGSKVQNDIEVTFRGLPVRSLNLHEIAFLNTGNRPIARADFDQPIQISLGDGGQILSWRVSASRPLELPVQVLGVSAEGAPLRTVSIAPLLLNAGDGFSIEFLVEGDARLETLCRAFGVQQIREATFGASEPNRIEHVLAFVPGAVTVFSLVILRLLDVDRFVALILSGSAGFSLGFLLFGRGNRFRFRRSTALPARSEAAIPPGQIA